MSEERSDESNHTHHDAKRSSSAPGRRVWAGGKPAPLETIRLRPDRLRSGPELRRTTPPRRQRRGGVGGQGARCPTGLENQPARKRDGSIPLPSSIPVNRGGRDAPWRVSTARSEYFTETITRRFLMIAGRIGKDGRVHRVVKFAVPSGRAIARCGRAGRAALVTNGMVSCCECLSRIETRHGASLQGSPI